MDTFEPRIETIIFVSLFLMSYLIFLIKKTLKNSIDLYDLMILSSVGVLPAALVFFPRGFHNLSRYLGVEFPFVLLFGALFFLSYSYMAYVVSKINKMRRNQVILIQELSLLKSRIEGESSRGDEVAYRQTSKSEIHS